MVGWRQSLKPCDLINQSLMLTLLDVGATGANVPPEVHPLGCIAAGNCPWQSRPMLTEDSAYLLGVRQG